MEPINVDTKPISGTSGNWPTADAIDHVINLAEQANGRSSPLHGLGNKFIEFGSVYGINPGFVAANLQKESQLGADGSILPTQCNNFGGNTWAASTGYPKCGAASGLANREWNQYPNAVEGLHGVFKNLNQPIYRNTGGRIRDVLEVYSPSYENDMGQMMLIISSTASKMGIQLTEDTNIYTNAGTVVNPLGNIPGTGSAAAAIAKWAIGGLQEGLLRTALVGIGLLLLFLGARKVL